MRRASLALTLTLALTPSLRAGLHYAGEAQNELPSWRVKLRWINSAASTALAAHTASVAATHAARAR